jgi:hypothetical protein
MATREQVYDAYAFGVLEAVALINENEDMKIDARGVLKALEIKQILDEVARQYDKGGK